MSKGNNEGSRVPVCVPSPIYTPGTHTSEDFLFHSKTFVPTKKEVEVLA